MYFKHCLLTAFSRFWCILSFKSTSVRTTLVGRIGNQNSRKFPCVVSLYTHTNEQIEGAVVEQMIHMLMNGVQFPPSASAVMI